MGVVRVRIHGVEVEVAGKGWVGAVEGVANDVGGGVANVREDVAKEEGGGVAGALLLLRIGGTCGRRSTLVSSGSGRGSGHLLRSRGCHDSPNSLLTSALQS